LARQLRQRGVEARTLYLVGEIHSSGGLPNANQALESYEQALMLAHELEMRPLEAQCHFALGELVLKTGERRGAQEQFKSAASMYRDMGMQYPLDETESALKAL
jgi:hypothetical protein